jgi:hypothetical protein
LRSARQRNTKSCLRCKQPSKWLQDPQNRGKGIEENPRGCEMMLPTRTKREEKLETEALKRFEEASLFLSSLK